MPRAVLLLHQSADGSHHFDWLLAPKEGLMHPDERALLSFRVADRIDGFALGREFTAVEMAPHRWLYLDYEGEISNGRGSVERAAEGIWTPRPLENKSICGEIEWSGRAPVSFEGRLIEADRWRFQICPPDGR